MTLNGQNYVSDIYNGKETLKLKNLKNGIYFFTISCKTGTCSEGYTLSFSCDSCGNLDNDVEGKINMKDIAIAAKAFSTRPGDPLWDPKADINYDDKVDMKDIGKIARVFGSTCIVSGELLIGGV